MATISVSDFPSFINQQIEAQERIEACMWQLEALIAVAVMTDNFYEISESILHNYFSAVGDLIEKATKANNKSLSELLKHRPIEK